MSRVSKCKRCGKNIVEPAYPGDGAYPVSPMCECADNQPNPRRFAPATGSSEVTG